MSAFWAVCRRELAAYFCTPLGYVFAVIFLFISCAYYAGSLFQNGKLEMRGLFENLPLLLLFFVPATAMRLWADERKTGTLELLMTYPLPAWQAVLAKFAAGTLFLAAALALTFHLPLLLQFALRPPAPAAGPDWGPILGGYLASLALGMTYLALGAFASSLTGNQVVAFVLAFGLNMLLYLLALPAVLNAVRETLGGAGASLAVQMERFGILGRFNSIARGVLDTRDVVFAASLCGFFLFLNVLVIQRRR